MNFYKYLLIYLITISYNSFCIYVIQADDNNQGSSSLSEKPFPSIWSNKQDGRDELEKTYRILAEIRLVKTNKTFLIEEWASGIEQTFRLDIVEYPRDKRVTLLYYKKTNELFEYKPFKCSLRKNISKSSLLPPSLVDVFPSIDESSFIPTGIGALWLHALRSNKSFIPASESNKTSYYNILNKKDILGGLNKYVVGPNDQFSWGLVFYVYNSHLPTTNAELVASIETGPFLSMDSPISTEAHIKLLEIESPFSIDEDTNQDDELNVGSIFDLPIGYGCERDKKLTNQQNVYKPPLGFFSIDKIVQPQLLELEVVSIQSIDFDQKISNGGAFINWKAHNSLVRILFGQLNRNKYTIVEHHHYVGAEQQSEKIQGAQQNVKLNNVNFERIKKVWLFDTNEEGDSIGEPNKNVPDKARSLYSINFDINERNGRCLGFREQSLLPWLKYISKEDNIMNNIEQEEFDDFNFGVEFPISSIDHLIDSKDKTTDEKNEEMLNILNLNTGLIRILLTSAKIDFHLIKELNMKTNFYNDIVKEYVYEKREKVFEMRNHDDGVLVWSGPVSFILNVVENSNFGQSKTNKYYNKRDGKVSLIMQFYSESLDKMLARIQINVIESRPIDEAYFHRELNVAPCYGHLISRRNDDNKDGYLKLLQRDEDSSFGVNIILAYPIEDKEIADYISSNDYAQSLIYDYYLKSMTSLTTEVINEQQQQYLDPLQLNDIHIIVNSNFLQISARLIDKPSILNYRQVPKQRFSKLNRKLLFVEFKLNEENCAESCQHYDCKMFTYCPRLKRCEMLLNEDSEKVLTSNVSLLLEHDFQCSVYFKRNFNHISISPEEFVNKLKQLIKKGDPLGKISFNFEYPNHQGDSNEIVRFVPTLIKINQNLKEDFFDLTNENNSQIKQQDTRLIDQPPIVDEQINNNSLMKPEYQLVEIESRFKDQMKQKSEMFPIEEAQFMSYDDCVELCNELDCKSFSYCKFEQTCMVSQLHKSKEIEENSERRELCTIMARDYLSKFRKVSENILKQQYAGVNELDSNNNFKKIPSNSNRDCSINCIEEKDFKCKSFYYCPAEQSSTNQGQEGQCYLGKRHLSARSIVSNSNKSAKSLIKDNVNHKSCQLYIRSFLNEFDKFFRKALPQQKTNYDEKQNIIVIKGLGAESCGVECGERNGLCKGFQVCKYKSSAKPLCGLLVMNDEKHAKEDDITYNDLIDDDNCTSFLISKDSELNWKTSLGNKNQTFDSVDSETQSQTGGVGFFKIFLLLLVGYFMGSITIIIINKFFINDKK